MKYKSVELISANSENNGYIVSFTTNLSLPAARHCLYICLLVKLSIKPCISIITVVSDTYKYSYSPSLVIRQRVSPCVQGYS